MAFKDDKDNTLLTIADNSIESSKPFRVSLSINAPFTCNNDKEGFIYFDKSSKAFKGCNGSEWRVLG